MKLRCFRLYFVAVIMLTFLTLMIVFPKVCLSSAKNGMILCADIIIPSLFPINFCIIFLMKLIGCNGNKKLKVFLIFVFSILGGYPTGSKLINEEYKMGYIGLETAKNMQLYSINAGIGFIISAVGFNIFGSVKIGVLLFSVHILSSLLLCLALSFKQRKTISVKTKAEHKNIADIFVSSAYETSNAIISICSCVIFFSVVCGLLSQNKILKYLCFFTEITSAISLTKNIYLISFLLSFGGLSVWFQVIAVSKDIKTNPLHLILSRLFCGAFSLLIMFLITKIFNISVNVISNNVLFTGEMFVNNKKVSVSLFIMIILLIISLQNKKSGGNLRDDLLK